MNFSVESLSESTSFTTASDDDSDDSVDTELKVMQQTEAQIDKPQHNDDTFSQNTQGGKSHEHSKSFSTNSSPIRNREIDADNDVRMTTIRTIKRESSLAGMLSWNNKNKMMDFDFKYDPFQTDGGMKVPPATADSTRTRKKVRWSGLQISAHNKEKNRRALKEKENHSTEPPHSSMRARKHQGSSSLSELALGPTSSDYSATPDVTDQGFLETTDVQTHVLQEAEGGSLLSSPTRPLSGPESLTSLFMPQDLDTAATSPPFQGTNAPGIDDNTVCSLARRFNNLSIQTSETDKHDNVPSVATSNMFSLRLSGSLENVRAGGVSWLESPDGSFEDILDTKPPQLPEISQSEFTVPGTTGTPSFQQHPQTLNQGNYPNPNNQATQIGQERLSRVLHSLCSVCDIPAPNIPSTARTELYVGEQLGLLERLVGQLSSKIEDRNVSKLKYENKVSQLTKLAEELTQGTVSLSKESRVWKLKYGVECEEFDDSVKRILRSLAVREVYEDRATALNLLVNALKELVVERERLLVLEEKLVAGEECVLELRTLLVALQQQNRDGHEKNRELETTVGSLLRFKEMLSSLEMEHRLLQHKYDELLVTTQSQSEELRCKRDECSETAQRLRDQTNLLQEQRLTLTSQTATIENTRSECLQYQQQLSELKARLRELQIVEITNNELVSEVQVLTQKAIRYEQMDNELRELKANAETSVSVLRELDELRQWKLSSEEELSRLLEAVDEQKLLLDRSTSELESSLRQKSRQLASKEDELRRAHLKLQDLNDTLNDYSKQVSSTRERLSDTIQSHNSLASSLESANDQSRELRLSLLKCGSQRDEIKRAFHSLEVSCVRCLDGVIQLESLEGIKQGLNSSLHTQDFSQELVILEDSAAFLNEALALLSKEYRSLLKRAESEQKIPLRKLKKSSSKKMAAIDDGNQRAIRDSDSVLSGSKMVTPARPVTRLSRRFADENVALTGGRDVHYQDFDTFKGFY